MYDGGNYILTNYTNDPIPYTHTQWGSEGSPGDDVGNYPMNGTVSSGDLYFGTGSTYFTNMYPGLFVSVAENIDISLFKIDGELGADGDGSIDSLDFYVTSTGDLETWGTSPSNIQYSVFVKRVFSANDPSVNHIIIFDNPLSPEGYTHSYSDDTDDDMDVIEINGESPNKVSYLLLAMSNGVKLSDEDVYAVVKEYVQLTNGSSISSVLSTLNNSYSSITGILDSTAASVYVKIYDKYNGDTIFDDFIDGALEDIYICRERIAIRTVDVHDNVYIFDGSDMIKILDKNFDDSGTIVDDYIYWDD